MRPKMTFEDLKSMFPRHYYGVHEKEGRDGLRATGRATHKLHRHAHQPTWFSTRKVKVSPAKYRRLHLGKGGKNGQ